MFNWSSPAADTSAQVDWRTGFSFYPLLRSDPPHLGRTNKNKKHTHTHTRHTRTCQNVNILITRVAGCRLRFCKSDDIITVFLESPVPPVNCALIVCNEREKRSYYNVVRILYIDSIIDHARILDVRDFELKPTNRRLTLL